MYIVQLYENKLPYDIYSYTVQHVNVHLFQPILTAQVSTDQLVL